LRTNSTRETYAFSDYPYPGTAEEFPTAEQVREYLNAYVEHFGLRPLLRLNTEVRAVSRTSGGAGDPGSTFTFTVRRRDGTGREARVPCDFVAVCNGVFSQPHLPEIDGRERFAGPVLHSSEVTDPELIERKRIVVVGAGKSALDCATWAARHGRACTLVCRAPHWMVPRYLLGRIPSNKLFFTRFFEAFTRYHSVGPFESFLHGPAKAVVSLWWRAQTGLLRRSLGDAQASGPRRSFPAASRTSASASTSTMRCEGAARREEARMTRFAGPTRCPGHG
jgi:cation diffusion facilitator CzcD-associated flavoprotein CzcO